VIEPGLARIRDYVGQGSTFPTGCMPPARWRKTRAALSRLSAADWLAMAKRVMVLNANGRIVYDYDMKIAEPFEKPGGEAGVDMWPGWKPGRAPVLLVRGALGHPLAKRWRMARRLPRPRPSPCLAWATPHAGRARDAAEAIERLLARVG
jgi:hypothetical protein